jgi:hypothetical protein
MLLVLRVWVHSARSSPLRVCECAHMVKSLHRQQGAHLVGAPRATKARVRRERQAGCYGLLATVGSG